MMENNATRSLAERIIKIRQQLPAQTRLIAVTKQVGITAMRDVYAAGIRDFGENRLQELVTKQEQLQDLPDITWHLIGHLQSNKARKAVESCQWIHSVDSLKLAQRLNQVAEELSLSPQICLQVKLAIDENKYGWTVEQLWSELPLLDQCDRLQIKGLMTILSYGLTPETNREIFTKARILAEKIQNHQKWSNINLTELSMGMSGDYLQAVEAGATMVRLGRIIFSKISE
jgi:PLP dependent protein